MTELLVCHCVWCVQVFAQLRTLAQPDSTADTLRTSRVDVLKRLGSKSPETAMVKQILRFACMATVDVASIEHICALAVRTARAPAAAGGAGGRAAAAAGKKKAAAKSRGSDPSEQQGSGAETATREVRVFRVQRHDRTLRRTPTPSSGCGFSHAPCGNVAASRRCRPRWSCSSWS